MYVSRASEGIFMPPITLFSEDLNFDQWCVKLILLYRKFPIFFKIFTPEVVSVWKADLHIHNVYCVVCSDAVYVVVVEWALPLMETVVCVDISVNGVTDCRRTNWALSLDRVWLWGGKTSHFMPGSDDQGPYVNTLFSNTECDIFTCLFSASSIIM